MAPVSITAVFAVKSLAVAGSNFLTTILFVIVPGVFYGLLFGTEIIYFFWVVLVCLGLWSAGTALAELLNLLVMRIVPPHRSREAICLIGGLAGIIIALIFQVPKMIISSG